MHTEDEILFETEPPSSEFILEKVRKISGLDDISLRNQNGKFEVLEHSLFLNVNKFLIVREGNKIIFMRGWNNPNYMLEIAISALVDLGGSYKGELESWTNEKWEDVRDKYLTE